MNEPSPEAKQAAWAAGCSYHNPKEYKAYCEGCDAATAKLRDQLAHQQPSAPDEPLFGEHIKEAISAVKPLFKTSAPTPDVEKIARELSVAICDRFGMTYPAVGFLGSKHWQDIKELILPAIAQACAPLVKALEQIRHKEPYSPGEESMQAIARAALTSTGEK